MSEGQAPPPVKRGPGRPRKDGTPTRRILPPKIETYISSRHLLTEQEVAFCINYVASGGVKASSYRKAFINDERTQTKAQIQQRTASLLARSDIQSYISELRESPSESARRRLAETVKLGDSAQAGKAAERVLADEDKLGVRDAALRFQEIMCESGAEIEVPVAGATCVHGHPVSLKVPMSDLFPHAAPKGQP